MKRQDEPHVIIRTNSLEGQRDHFISRLKDRYEISITNDEYDKLCPANGIFHGAFSKNRRKTVGWIFIKGIKVWVLRDGEVGRLATCYPPAVEYSDIEMMRSCFGGASRLVAITIYRLYIKESLKIGKMKFDSVKDAAIYMFSKTMFPVLHIDKYKYGSVKTVKVANYINRILCGKSDYVEISLKKIKKLNSEPNPERSVATDDASSNADRTTIIY